MPARCARDYGSGYGRDRGNGTAEGAGSGHAKTASSYFVYVGGRGIYQYRFDEKTGTMTSMGVAAEMRSVIDGWPRDSQHRYLYAIGAPAIAPNQADLRGGAVSSFSIDPRTGALKYLNSMPAGAEACTSDLDKTGKILFAANYGSGSRFVSFAIKDDGSIGAMDVDGPAHRVRVSNPGAAEGPASPHSGRRLAR